MGTPIAKALEAQGISFKTPIDADWCFYSSTYNARVPVKPKIVMLPKSVDEVSKSVVCASEYGMKVQARCGGHSYASHSNGGADGAAVIDLRLLQDVVLSDDIVRVGGGVRLGKLAQSIYEKGRALSHGTCPAVGVGGHFTHGGYGLSSRAWGLAMDQVVALDVVCPDGSVRRASEGINQELFFAMRGAADSFGIAVNFYLKTQPAPETIIKWSVDVPEVMKNAESATQAFKNIQDFANDATVVDRHIGFVVFLDHGRFTVEGTFLGSRERFSSIIMPAILSKFPQKATIQVDMRQVDWLTCLRLLCGELDLSVSGVCQEQHVFYAKSAIIPSPGLEVSTLKRYFECVLQQGVQAPVGYFISAQLYGGADSQITSQTREDSFGHRNAIWVFQHYGFVDDKGKFPSEGMRFIEDLNKALGEGRGAYNNYADPSLGSEEAQRLYYGDKFAKLKLLKGKLDPNNVFSHPQSIQKD
ncbi:Glucooligosaccharide oxidase [Xylariaceae sp. FL0255]|nr:Glucooligosaccharide oxidase [Xylariaceae sp. FL0255]